MKLFALLTTLLLGFSAHASPAKCLLQVDGKTYLNGICNFENEGNGSFTIGTGSVNASRYFAYVLVWGNGTAHAYWNGEEAGPNAHDNLGPVKRDGACRYNSRVRVCAWAL